MKKISNPLSTVGLCFFAVWLIISAVLLFMIFIPPVSVTEILLMSLFFLVSNGMFFLFLLSEPMYYVFSYDGVELRFMFGYFKVFAWKDISEIYRQDVNSRRLSHTLFVIKGVSTGKQAFFTRRISIRANEKTEEMMRKYWKKRILYEGESYRKLWTK